METRKLNLNVQLYEPAEFFDLVDNSKGRVRAYSIYHKAKEKITDEDIASSILGLMGSTDYCPTTEKGRIYYSHPPISHYPNKKQFCNEFEPYSAVFFTVK